MLGIEIEGEEIKRNAEGDIRRFLVMMSLFTVLMGLCTHQHRKLYTNTQTILGMLYINYNSGESKKRCLFHASAEADVA